MITAINRSLAKKREMLENNEKGFTLIELLVVVLIIGVLAAIAIPIYIGVQDTAKDNAVQAAVTQVKTAAVAQYTTSGTFPAHIVDVTAYAGSADITVTMGIANTPGTAATASDFCINGEWSGGGHEYYIDQSNASTAGSC